MYFSFLFIKQEEIYVSKNSRSKGLILRDKTITTLPREGKTRERKDFFPNSTKR